QRVEIPGEHEARLRAWAVVSAAYERRERVSWPRRHARALALAAAVAAILAVVLSPAGGAVVRSLRDAVGRQRVVVRPAPARVSLPAPGRVLIVARSGAWILHRDGSKRRLGGYRLASWSPHGLFVVVARGGELTAVDPKGAVRWSLHREAPVTLARW